MNLENLVNFGEWETTISSMLPEPWWMKVFYWDHYSALKKSLNRATQLKESDARDSGWYVEYGTAFNDSIVAVKKMAERTYTIYNIFRPIPIIGNLIENLIKRYAGQALSSLLPESEHESGFRIPEQNETMEVLDSGHETLINGYCEYAAASTDMDPVFYKEKLSPNKKPFMKSLADFGARLSTYISSIFI